MLTPGAVTSGLRPLSPPRGPPEVKLANPVKLSFVTGPATTVIAPLAARSFAPSDDSTLAGPFAPRKGIVTLKGTPSSGLKVIGPSTGGKPGTSFTITTAAARACWPKIAFATRAQVPRFTTAIVFGPSEPKSATLQPSDSSLEVVVGSSLMTLMLKVDEPANANPLALIAGIVVVPEKVSIAPGSVRYGSFAATEMAPSAVDGEPMTYGLGPALPADATTMTPALAAVVDATADGSSFEPNGEPSDMLMTSMSLSTAHSIAPTTTSVGPWQPNTRTA